MAGRKKTYQVTVDERQRQELHQVVASRKSAQSLVQRARIVLLCAQQPAWSDRQVATEVGCSAGQVRKWRKRWCETHSLQEAVRSGRPRVFSP
jgi:transposase